VTPQIQVRPAGRDDLQQILDIYNEAVLNTTASYDYEPRTLEHRQTWFEEHERAKYPIFVATDAGGKVVGWSALNPYHSRMGYQFTSENSIYVAADWRSKGVGKLLMPPLIEGARKRGLHVIIAAIDAANPASVHLHERFGFQKVGHMKEVGFKFGRWLDVIYMELIL
jgi:L-amino acid N-acyltransferase YncA